MPDDPQPDARDQAGDVPTPLESLGSLAALEVELAPDHRHVEIYTEKGLLTFFRHGPAEAQDVVLMCGGALGGVLGPADGLYHDLAVTLAGQGIGTVRVGYRKPNDLGRCVHDMAAAADLCARSGAERFVTIGHSFGGAVALNAGIAFGEHCAGVVTLATQSAGCENAEQLGDTPLLLMHGDADQLLPFMASEMVAMLAGKGELVPLAGAGHLLTEASDELRSRLTDWIPARFSDHRAPA
ncbi:MAG: alpha/beta fold hydrolase [Actinomycetia bacterium]|nr:alpha/beta fold hydrolase [Actinomycetes bacterium]MCP4962592.1 alpha/beta fold hydrolase [Actinomycetes bacterium]